MPMFGTENVELAVFCISVDGGKMPSLKVVNVQATFPELSGSRCYQRGRGQGTTLATAMGAAVRDLVRQKGLKRQRFSTFSATFSIGTIKEEVPTDGTGEASEDQAERYSQ